MELEVGTIQEDVEMFGKYMPIRIGNIMYSHPLSQNLYGLNYNLENINKLGKIHYFEGEKSVLHYESMFELVTIYQWPLVEDHCL